MVWYKLPGGVDVSVDDCTGGEIDHGGRSYVNLGDIEILIALKNGPNSSDLFDRRVRARIPLLAKYHLPFHLLWVQRLFITKPAQTKYFTN